MINMINGTNKIGFVCPFTGEYHVMGETQRDLLGVDKTFASGSFYEGGILIWEKGDETGYISVKPQQLWDIEFAIKCRKIIYSNNT